MARNEIPKNSIRTASASPKTFSGTVKTIDKSMEGPRRSPQAAKEVSQKPGGQNQTINPSTPNVTGGTGENLFPGSSYPSQSVPHAGYSATRHEPYRTNSAGLTDNHAVTMGPAANSSPMPASSQIPVQGRYQMMQASRKGGAEARSGPHSGYTPDYVHDIAEAEVPAVGAPGPQEAAPPSSVSPYDALSGQRSTPAHDIPQVRQTAQSGAVSAGEANIPPTQTAAAHDPRLIRQAPSADTTEIKTREATIRTADDSVRSRNPQQKLTSVNGSGKDVPGKAPGNHPAGSAPGGPMQKLTSAIGSGKDVPGKAPGNDPAGSAPGGPTQKLTSAIGSGKEGPAKATGSSPTGSIPGGPKQKLTSPNSTVKESSEKAPTGNSPNASKKALSRKASLTQGERASAVKIKKYRGKVSTIQNRSTFVVKQPTGVIRTSGTTISTSGTIGARRSGLPFSGAAGQAQRASRVARAMTRTAEKAAEVGSRAVRAAGNAVTRVAATAQSSYSALLAALTAGGATISIPVVLSIGIVAAILGSFFGIFFSPEATADDGNLALRAIIREINLDYSEEIQTIQAIPHDTISLSGQRSDWREVLALYSVLLSMDEDNPTEVVSMDPEKKEFLQDLFWRINSISSYTTTEIIVDYVEVLDEYGFPIRGRDGLPLLEEVWIDITHLFITVSHIAPDAVPERFGLSEDQKQAFNELLSPAYDEMWQMALYGIGPGDTNIVNVALSQVGQIGGDPYWSYVGYRDWVNWCACFVSWCANECGYVDSGLFPKTAGVGGYESWFRRQAMDRSYVPNPGDLIIFDWEQDGYTDHIGIVEKVEGGKVWTIEGNSGDAVVNIWYYLTSPAIQTYLVPDYGEAP